MLTQEQVDKIVLEFKIQQARVINLEAKVDELKDNIRNLNITIGNAAEWSEKQAAEIAELVDMLRKAHFRLERGFEYSDPDIVAILAKYEK